VRATTATRAPDWASLRATERPMPDEPPVTSAIFSLGTSSSWPTHGQRWIYRPDDAHQRPRGEQFRKPKTKTTNQNENLKRKRKPFWFSFSLLVLVTRSRRSFWLYSFALLHKTERRRAGMIRRGAASVLLLYRFTAGT
jgi:hypothetical protein